VAQSGHTMSFLPKAWSDALPGEAGPSDSYIISTFGIQGKCPVGGCAEHGTYGEALAPGRWDPASYQGAFPQWMARTETNCASHLHVISQHELLGYGCRYTCWCPQSGTG
jgi:hypothetical protein